jgi:hypothetical protein
MILNCPLRDEETCRYRFVRRSSAEEAEYFCLSLRQEPFHRAICRTILESRKLRDEL